MPEKDRDDDEPFASAVTIDRDGNIEGLHTARDPRPLETWERPKPAPAPEAPLELAREPPPPEDPLPPPPSHSRALLAGVLGAALLLTAAGIFALVHRGPPAPAASAPLPDESGPPAMTIESEPSGAAVFLDGEELGHTPLLGQNPLAAGAKGKLRLSLDGYAPWSAAIDGGRKLSLRAKLSRK